MQHYTALYHRQKSITQEMFEYFAIYKLVESNLY